LAISVAGSTKILVPIYKITILCVRLISYAEELIWEYQGGFWRRRSTFYLETNIGKMLGP